MSIDREPVIDQGLRVRTGRVSRFASTIIRARRKDNPNLRIC